MLATWLLPNLTDLSAMKRQTYTLSCINKYAGSVWTISGPSGKGDTYLWVEQTLTQHRCPLHLVNARLFTSFTLVCHSPTSLPLAPPLVALFLLLQRFQLFQLFQRYLVIVTREINASSCFGWMHRTLILTGNKSIWRWCHFSTAHHTVQSEFFRMKKLEQKNCVLPVYLEIPS